MADLLCADPVCAARRAVNFDELNEISLTTTSISGAPSSTASASASAAVQHCCSRTAARLNDVRGGAVTSTATDVHRATASPTWTWHGMTFTLGLPRRTRLPLRHNPPLSLDE